MKINITNNNVLHLKKYLLLIIFIFLNISYIFCEDENSFLLEWKISENEIIKYKTIFHNLETSDNNLNHVLDEIDKIDPKFTKKTQKLLQELNKSLEKTDIRTILFKQSDDVLNIKMLAKLDEKQSDENELIHKFIKLNDGVLLRGAISKTGQIESFWIKNGQKNLIALMFELPNKKIQIGDKWDLDIHFIENDQNFICNESERNNEVSFVSFKRTKDDVVIMLNYDIREYVKGEMNSPINNNLSDLTMEFAFKGVSEFSMNSGRWISYDGILRMNIEGVMNVKQIQKISLINTD